MPTKADLKISYQIVQVVKKIGWSLIMKEAYKNNTRRMVIIGKNSPGCATPIPNFHSRTQTNTSVFKA